MAKTFFEMYAEEHPDKFPKIDISDRTKQPGDTDFKEFVESLTFRNSDLPDEEDDSA